MSGWSPYNHSTCPLPLLQELVQSLSQATFPSMSLPPSPESKQQNHPPLPNVPPTCFWVITCAGPPVQDALPNSSPENIFLDHLNPVHSPCLGAVWLWNKSWCWNYCTMCSKETPAPHCQAASYQLIFTLVNTLHSAQLFSEAPQRRVEWLKVEKKGQSMGRRLAGKHQRFGGRKNGILWCFRLDVPRMLGLHLRRAAGRGELSTPTKKGRWLWGERRAGPPPPL